MASVVADGDDAMFPYKSVIRGHHIYKDIWTPRMAEVLSVVVINMIILQLPSLKLWATCLEQSVGSSFSRSSSVSSSCLVAIIIKPGAPAGL